MRTLSGMQPTPFSDAAPRDLPPAVSVDGPIELPELGAATTCPVCESSDGDMCPIHGSLILELL